MKEKTNIQVTPVSVHPCVQNYDFETLKFTFTPPLNRFILCHYTATNIEKLPLRGYYQMKVCCCSSFVFLNIFYSFTTLIVIFSPHSICFFCSQESSSTEVKILIQLKLEEEVNNDFEYCNVDIPFPNRYSSIDLQNDIDSEKTKTFCIILSQSHKRDKLLSFTNLNRSLFDKVLHHFDL